MEHFGITLYASKYGLELNRENYAIINNKSSFPRKYEGLKDAYADETGRYYTDTWCLAHREKCLENFDLNMKFFQSLNHDEFEHEIISFLQTHRQFKEIVDLNECDGISGYYLMVLDKYCQIYIGTTDNIKRRIRQHWTKTKSFDRLLFPMDAVNTSIIAIDSFRALDTTRIFIYATYDRYTQEDAFINCFPPKFISNRIGGGKWEDNPLWGFQVAATMKSHELVTK